MAKGDKGISGLAVALATAGGLLVFAGIKNVSPLEALRAAAAGKPIPEGPKSGIDVQSAPPPNVQAPGAPGPVPIQGIADGGSLNSAIVANARRYLGIRYKIDGADPNGFDCSGLVTWVLHHDLGLNLPSNTHTITTGFLTWSGAQTVSRDQMAAGDLVCWPGHIGIATSSSTMISAPTLGENVHETGITWIPAPVIRRVIPQGSAATVRNV
jgi:cell wall-associated NlpC family hydrolase